MGSLLESLPRSVLTTVLERVAEVSNPGSAFRVALASKTLLYAVATVEGFWLALCRKQGWRKPPAAPAAKPRSDNEEALWFQYYCHRMQLRWRTRRFMRLYTPFMTRASSMALIPGAGVRDLDATEQRLRLGLPWELWELYRFRNGQAEATGVRFAEDCRLLSVQEMYTEPLAAGTLPWTPQLQSAAAAAAAATHLQGSSSTSGGPQEGGLSPSDETVLQRGPLARLLRHGAMCSHPQEGQEVGTPAAGAGPGSLQAAAASALQGRHGEQQLWPPAGQEVLKDDTVVFFAENTSGKRRFGAVVATGQVVVTSGMSVILCAHSLSAFLQRLLT